MRSNRKVMAYVGEIASGRGDWIELPYYDLEELEGKLKAAGVNTDREYMVYDIDNSSGINLDEVVSGYCPSLKTLNEAVLYIEELEDYELEHFEILTEHQGYYEALETMERGGYYIITGVKNKYDLLYALLEDEDIPAHIINYIDTDYYISENTVEYNESDGWAIVYE